MTDAFEISQDGEIGKIVLAPIMDMATSDEFLNVVRSVAASHTTIHFDAHMVERLSTPCVQVIAACALEMEKKGGVFHITSPSQAFLRGMTDLGFKEYLDNWSKS